jgi:hypothetical protein
MMKLPMGRERSLAAKAVGNESANTAIAYRKRVLTPFSVKAAPELAGKLAQLGSTSVGTAMSGLFKGVKGALGSGEAETLGGVPSTGSGSGNTLSAMRRMEFEGADYHGTVSNSVKSRGPVNGQDALDTSVQVKSTSTRRVGIDYETGDFVIFDNTINNVYHGHVRAWPELRPEMQNALQRAGMVDRRGNILGGQQ